jgi:lipopolysaccharide export system permease protein
VSRLDRYVLRLFLLHLLIALAALLSLYLGIDAVERLRWLTRGKLPLEPFLRFFWYRAPLALSQVLPLAGLLAATLTVARLNQRNELTAMRAAGIAPARAMLPLLLGGLLAGLVQAVVVEFRLPDAQLEQARLEAKARVGRPLETTDRWFADGPRRVRVGGLEEASRLRDVEMLTVEGDDRVREHLLAATATWDGAAWVGEGVKVWTFDEEGGVRYEALPERPLLLRLPPAALGPAAPEPDQLRYAALRDAIRQGKRSGHDVRGLELALELRRLLPLSCLLLILVGAPRGARPGAGAGVAASIAQALGLSVVYLALTGVAALLAQRGVASPPLLIWPVQGLWALLGSVALSRLR